MNSVETTRMSTRGQVIIPKTIRDKYGYEKDELFAVKAIEGGVILRRLDRKKLLEDFRKIEEKVQKRYPSTFIDEEIKAVRRH